VVVGSDEVIIQLDEGLLNPFLRHTQESSHQDHKRKKHFCHYPSQLMREENILPPQDGKDEEQAT